MLCSVKRRRTLLLCIAVSFASIDLVHKSLRSADFHHARSQLVALVMAAVIVALVVLVPRIPSDAAAVGAGIACGGALGNLISLLAWSQGVPDPLVLGDAGRGIAFNLADLFAVTGDALLLCAAVLYGIRNRARLSESV
jgi:lipoprotein signal peptidase